MKHERFLTYSIAFFWTSFLVSFVFLNTARVADSRSYFFDSSPIRYVQTLQIYGTGEHNNIQGHGLATEHLNRPRLSSSSNQRSPSVEEIKRYVCSDKFKWDCAKIRRIIFCESTYREKVVSRTGDVGVLQIAPVHGYSVSYLSDYRNNIDAGYKLFLARGYQPWYSSAKCWKIK